MASSSASSHSTPASSQSCKYDVFLSFRGEDVRKTFVDHFYSALTDRHIHTYKDDITLRTGESIGPSLFKAVEESRMAVIIFSKNYAGSSWCLEELACIMKANDKSGLIVMPVFYDVDPSEVRKQRGDFGKAFAKKEVENVDKAESWRKALVDAGNIAGWEPKNIANGSLTSMIPQPKLDLPEHLIQTENTELTLTTDLKNSQETKEQSRQTNSTIYRLQYAEQETKPRSVKVSKNVEESRDMWLLSKNLNTPWVPFVINHQVQPDIIQVLTHDPQDILAQLLKAHVS